MEDSIQVSKYSAEKLVDSVVVLCIEDTAYIGLEQSTVAQPSQQS